jgi:hypothetical protein
VPSDHRLVARRGGCAAGRLRGRGEPDYDTGVQRAYLAWTRVLSALLVLVGVAMVASALARGGGALALGVVLGALMALLGAGRLWLARGTRAGGRR